MVNFVGAYPWILATGALVALLWLGFAPLEDPTPDDRKARIDAGLVALFAGLVGARAGYVFSRWGYFAEHLTEALYVWQGGLSWASALVAVLIALGATTGR